MAADEIYLLIESDPVTTSLIVPTSLILFTDPVRLFALNVRQAFFNRGLSIMIVGWMRYQWRCKQRLHHNYVKSTIAIAI